MIEAIKKFLFGSPKKVKKPQYKIKEEAKRSRTRSKRKKKKNTRTK